MKITISVINRAGESAFITGVTGKSLMEELRDNGYDEIMALCGGCCSCATCHVYVVAPNDSLISSMSSEENELLDGSGWRRKNSRLSCQIELVKEMSGLEVTIPPEG